MGSLFVDILTESKCSLTPEYRNLINEIANSFECVPSLGVPFLRECLTLSKAMGPRMHGDALLHKQIALKLWRLRGEKEEKEKGANEGVEEEKQKEKEAEEEYRSAAVLHFAMGESPEALWVQVDFAVWLCIFVCLPVCFHNSVRN